MIDISKEMQLTARLINPFIFNFLVLLAPSGALAATIVYEITKGVVAYQVSVRGEVFVEKNLTIEYKSGQIIFSSNPDGTGDTFADDAVVMTFKKQGTSQIKTFKHDYETDCSYLNALSPKDLTSYFTGEGTYDINVKIKDECGHWAASSAMYLVNINAPEPSVSPTPTPPEPFLDLPWNYDCRQIDDEEVISECEKRRTEKKGRVLTFEEAVLKINSFFDHEYPLQSRGLDLKEPTLLIATSSVTFEGYPRKSIKNDDVWYSSHDGYDYGSRGGAFNGDPVYPAAPGIAEYYYDNGGGHTIKIDHGNGYQTRYHHLQDKSYYPSQKNIKTKVSRSTVIGKVGSTGSNSSGPHIHFGVFYDKNYQKDGEHNFVDYEPMGATDPFGWMPYAEEKDRDPDPWEHYTFDYLGKQQTGTKSYYLWKKKIPNIKEAVTDSGGTYSAGKVSAQIGPDTFEGTVTLYMNLAPSAKATDTEWSIGPVLSIKAKNLLDDYVTLLFKPVKLIWQPFNDVDLSRFKPGTFYLYSSKDAGNWIKETEVNPFSPGEITAVASHFSYFAIMGERKDMTPPTTTVVLNGTHGQDSWFRSDVELRLHATDNADMDPAGVNYILHKIEGEDWKTYSQPLTFTDEGHYKVSFYSGDFDGNKEEVKSIEFDIDKTLPTVNIDANLKSIWPPNGKIVNVQITGNIIEDNLESKSFQVIDEYGELQPNLLDFNQTIQLEAKRKGKDKDGRKYVIKVVAVDKAGNTTEAITEVIVAHDKGK